MPADADDVFDPAPVLELFSDAKVDFVVIGGVAGGAHGSSYGTFDVDLAYDRAGENLERIATVLRSIDATLRAPPDVPFQLDARTLEEGGNFTLRPGSARLTFLRIRPERRRTSGCEQTPWSSTSAADWSASLRSTI